MVVEYVIIACVLVALGIFFTAVLAGADLAVELIGGLVKGVIALLAGFIGFTLGVLCIGGVIGWLLTASGVL